MSDSLAITTRPLPLQTPDDRRHDVWLVFANSI
jgi:hypothetical protein